MSGSEGATSVQSAVERIRRALARRKVLTPSGNPKLPDIEAAALLAERDELIAGIRQIHQRLKRGEATQDHGPAGNLVCILDHITDIPELL